MFSSLHKIDIVATSPAGAMTLVQTDHRTPAEVGEDQGLSMIFALTRMLVPRTGEYAEATVQYACVGAVHPLLETAAAACVLVADWVAAAGVRLDPPLATALYTGIATDTTAVSRLLHRHRRPAPSMHWSGRSQIQ